MRLIQVIFIIYNSFFLGICAAQETLRPCNASLGNNFPFDCCPHNHFQKEESNLHTGKPEFYIYGTEGSRISFLNQDEFYSTDEVVHFINTFKKGIEPTYNVNENNLQEESKKWQNHQGFYFDTLEIRPADLYLVYLFPSTNFQNNLDVWSSVRNAICKRYDLFIDVFFVQCIEKTNMGLFPLNAILNKHQIPVND